MPQKCTICSNKNRAEIDAVLLDSGTSIRSIAKQYRVTSSAIQRHKAHIKEAIQQAQLEGQVITKANLIKEVSNLLARSKRFLERAEAAEQARDGLPSIREARSCIELLARLSGDLREGPTINFVSSPQWMEVKSILLSALSQDIHAEARAALSAALLELNKRLGV